MTVIRIHQYSVDPTEVAELITRRGTLIDALRAAHPGLAETRLIRQQDGTFVDTWRWDSAGQMEAALAALAEFPQARAAMSLTRDNRADDGEIVDERLRVEIPAGCGDGLRATRQWLQGDARPSRPRASRRRWVVAWGDAS